MVFRPNFLLAAALVAILVSQSNAYQAKMVVKGEKVSEQLSNKVFSTLTLNRFVCRESIKSNAFIKKTDY